MHKQQPRPNLPARLLSTSLLLCACQGSAHAAITTTPPPIIDTDPPTLITVNVPVVRTHHTTRPVITLDMATEVASSVKATDSAAAGSTSTDFIGIPTGQIGPLAPGRHTITWIATDVGNNSTECSDDPLKIANCSIIWPNTGNPLSDVIDVLPRANFAVDQKVGTTSSSVRITLYLSGNAPDTVTIPFSISGTANYTPPASTSLSIAAGEQKGNIDITLSSGNTNGSTIILTMGTPTNADAGSHTSHTITLTADNLAPIISITATQGGSTTPTHAITTVGGQVTLTAVVRDPNGDTISPNAYDWSASDTTLVPTGGTTSSTFTFDPTGLTPGVYTARLTVTDGSATSTRDMQLRVYNNTTVPTLSSSDDSDDDGVDDNQEGITDSDSDGIPNYLDAVSNPAWLPGWDLLTYKANLKRSDTFVAGPITFDWKLDTITSNRVYYPLLLATEPGLNLGIGPTAFANDSNYGRIDTAAASLYFGSSLPVDTISADGQVVDVEISGLGTTGQSVYLVIPLAAPLPPNSPGSPIFKVMSSQHTWGNFFNQKDKDGNPITDTLLFITSKDSDNYCPPPKDGGYTTVTAGSSALSSGVSCIELLIEDGGPNDYDGQANGIIRLLGAPFITATSSGTTITPPPEFNGTAENSVESLNKIALTEGGGGIGFIGLWGVMGLLLAYRLR